MDTLAPRPSRAGGLRLRLILLLICVTTLVAATLAEDGFPRATAPDDGSRDEWRPTASSPQHVSESRATPAPSPSLRHR